MCVIIVKNYIKKVIILRKNKIINLLIFILISNVLLAENSNKKKKISDEAVKVEIIINKKDESSRNDYLEESNNEEREAGYIYLDKDDTDVKEVKKENKVINKLDKFIRKIDEKVNPTLKFYVPASYGTWYLIKTTDPQEANFQNVRYNFAQEMNGYRITRDYFIPANQIWVENNERAWIKEEKGKVYLSTEAKLFKSFKNEILFFDRKYKYMVIRYQDTGVVRVFSREPDDNVDLEGNEKSEYESILKVIPNLKDVEYDTTLRNDEIEKSRKEYIEQERARLIEEEINAEPEKFFQIDTGVKSKTKKIKEKKSKNK